MGTVFLHGNGGSGGGSGGLDLIVVGGTTRPSKVSQNTIWVDTDVDITGYYFQAEQPVNMKEGELWLAIGDSGNIKVVSPVGGDWITVYPISAKQYVSGAWVDKAAKSYQNGEWVDLWLGELYVAGDEYAGTTGGWVFEAGSGNTTAYGNKDASSITVGSSSTVANFDSRATHNNLIALERFAELQVHFTTAKTGGSSTCVVKICIYDANDTVVGTTNVLSGQSKTLSDQWHTVDISGLPDGVYKVKIHALHTSSSKQYCYATFDEVRCV